MFKLLVNPPVQKSIYNYIPWFIIAILSVSLIGLSFSKALFTSFTHDESFTFNHFVHSSISDIFTYKYVSANNHLLNTLLMKLFGHCFGESEIILRLPNIIAHAGYILFSLLILRRLNPWLILPLFTLLNFNPYFLDFFSLARGNGLSYCFLLGSVYFFLKYTISLQGKYYCYSLLSAFLGVLSHFVMLYYFLSLIMVYNLWPFISRYIRQIPYNFNLKQWLWQNTINVFGIILLAVLLVGPVRKLILYNQLFYGGDRGFWIDTVLSLIQTSLYGCRYATVAEKIIEIFILIVLLGNSLFFGYILLFKKKDLYGKNQLLLLVFLLLILAAFINMIQFYIFGTKLLIRRFGLLFFPLFMLDLCFLSQSLIRIKQVKFMVLSMICVLSFFVTLHTCRAFSPVKYLDWEYETDTKTMVNILKKRITQNTPDDSIVLGCSWVYSPTINFYKDIYNLNWLKATDKENPLPVNATYFFMQKEELSKIPIANRRFNILFDSEISILVRVF